MTTAKISGVEGVQVGQREDLTSVQSIGSGKFTTDFKAAQRYIQDMYVNDC